MTDWQKLWHDPAVIARWEKMPPLPQVIEMADILASAGRRRLLDIGCGIGRHTVYLAARGFDVTALDNAPAALDACRASLEDLGLHADLLPRDMTDLTFPAAHFDGAVASMVIHHTDLATLTSIIGRITDTLSPTGLFVWVTPTPRHFACGRGREIEPNTWIGSDAADGDLPHHYSTEAEVRHLLHAYEILSIHEGESVEAEQRKFHWDVLARKAMAEDREPR